MTDFEHDEWETEVSKGCDKVERTVHLHTLVRSFGVRHDNRSEVHHKEDIVTQVGTHEETR